MNDQYPFTVPIILNDTIYSSYGGWTGTSNSIQRQAAYFIAERDVSSHIGTVLLPEWITGSYNVPRFGKALSLDFSRVQKVAFVNVYDEADVVFVTGSDLNNSFMLDSEHGYIDPNQIYELCNLKGLTYPAKIEITYRAGLPTGTANNPDMLLALTMLASNSLKEIVDAGALESGAGDQGVQEFSTQGYREVRVALQNTVFGNSPVANKVRKLLLPYVMRSGLRV